MDALSDLLRVLHFEGGVFLDATFRQPWCIQSQVTEDDCGPTVSSSAGLIAFHYVLEGRLEVQVGNEPALRASRGQVIVLPRNDAHLLGTSASAPTLAAESLIRRASALDLAQIDFGDGPHVRSQFVCGYLATSAGVHPLVEALPRVFVASMHGRPCAEWVESSFRFAAREHAARRPGSRTILARLAELLFVEALREYIENLPSHATGWLAALRDPPLARALAALHARVAHAWTTEELAEQALLSRSAFAERFVRTLGVPPKTYLTRWRMSIAAERLRGSAATLAEIAAEVGYDSESTFSRAFSREMGVAPGAYRRTG